MVPFFAILQSMSLMKSTHRVAKSAVLLVNLGSPDAPTPAALRRYLAEFLSDPRVIDLPRWQWWPLLHGIILPLRPKKSAALYQKIWTADGAPLIAITRKQTDALAEALAEQGMGDVIVDYAMRYGNPSLAERLAALAAQNVENLLVIPMYPQYAGPTTASVLDGLAQAFKTQRFVPQWRFVHHWHDHPRYIQALANRFSDYLQQEGVPDRLLLSYHGVPERYRREGDPYFCHCHKTSRLLAEAIDFPSERVQMVFQSRFGREPWLQPYADETLDSLPGQGVAHVAVMCPGFSADCLETLEEMAIANRQRFLNAGGKRYDYLAALNDQPDHIALLLDLIKQQTQGWADFHHPGGMERVEQAERSVRQWRQKFGGES